ncbi:NAD(P)/FAD-dependent oxidoreductase [Pseudooceanicola nanhaiensis]|uniref:NAD(P)/FAD-dependent oxidoreductase n=1 Tax=Pseudooceanicola nanhaiensis TaxID=375761 RepID=UPI001CD46429|nr:FAD-binding oxidoreductase [Pseudooceanicola nanhaiensis]MCA0920822.1 FAD-binding oxidoreductase [Pseudooceanicola nanhaiensis]
MPAPLTRIDTSPDLPARSDVVVIGGGIVGICTAYYLAQRGVSVTLLEKGLVGAEQSSRNWGWCRQQNRDARELPMATKSLELWDAMKQETGIDTGFRRCGLTYLSDSESEIEGWANWCDFAKTRGVRSHAFGAEEAARRGEATGRGWKGGVYSPDDGIADPSLAVPAIAQGVLHYGGHVVQGCAARGIETAAGRVSGVITEKGTIACDRVVMAGGAWASSFCRTLGISFPQAATRSSILSVTAGAEGLPPALHTSQVSVTQRSSGGYTLAISGKAQLDPTLQQLRHARHYLPMFWRRRRNLSPGGMQAFRAGHERLTGWALDRPTPMERTRILDPKPNRAVIEETLRRAQVLLPELSKTRIEASWAGYIDSTPDGVPVIGEIPRLPGFFLAAGFSGHGFGIGPGAGLLIADMVTGAASYEDPAHYALSRFAGFGWQKVAEF